VAVRGDALGGKLIEGKIQGSIGFFLGFFEKILCGPAGSKEGLLEMEDEKKGQKRLGGISKIGDFLQVLD